VSSATARGAEAQAETPKRARSGSSILGPSQPLLRRLARYSDHRPTGNGIALASERLEGLLALAVTAAQARRAPKNFAGAERADPPDGA